MISLRLEPDLEKKLNEISRNENVTKTEIIKKALVAYFERYNKKQNPYDLGKDLFGKYGSGNKNLSKDYKLLVKDKLNNKFTHSSA